MHRFKVYGEEKQSFSDCDFAAYSLKTLKSFLVTSYGPNASLKLFHNGSTTGQIIISSSSVNILKFLNHNNPYLHFTCCTIKNQLQSHSDLGLFTGLCLCEIVYSFQLRNFKFPHRVVFHIFDQLVDFATNILMKSHLFNIPFELASIENLKSVVCQSLLSKPGCMLSETDAHHIALTVIKTFLHVVANDSVGVDLGKICYISKEGIVPECSEMVPGILYPVSLDEFEAVQKDFHCEDPVGVALIGFNIDLNDEESVGAKLINTRHSEKEGAFMLEAQAFCDRLLHNGDVKVAACQKRVHPDVQRYLRKKGCLCLERMGERLFTCLSKMLKVPIIASLLSDSKIEVGFATLDFIEKFEKYFVRLNNDGGLATVFLSHPNPINLEELEETVKKTFSILCSYLIKSECMPGAGCAECVLAHEVYLAGRSKLTTENQVVSVFCEALVRLGMALHQSKKVFLIDNFAFHLWFMEDKPSDRCACRLLGYEDLERGNAAWGHCTRSSINADKLLSGQGQIIQCSSKQSLESCIVDSSVAKRDAFRRAFDNAKLLIRVKGYISYKKN